MRFEINSIVRQITRIAALPSSITLLTVPAGMYMPRMNKEMQAAIIFLFSFMTFNFVFSPESVFFQSVNGFIIIILKFYYNTNLRAGQRLIIKVILIFSD